MPRRVSSLFKRGMVQAVGEVGAVGVAAALVRLRRLGGLPEFARLRVARRHLIPEGPAISCCGGFGLLAGVAYYDDWAGDAIAR